MTLSLVVSKEQSGCIFKTLCHGNNIGITKVRKTHDSIKALKLNLWRMHAELKMPYIGWKTNSQTIPKMENDILHYKFCTRQIVRAKGNLRNLLKEKFARTGT